MLTSGKWRLTILSQLVCFAAMSCIPIDDLGEYWAQGVVDRRLEGHWKVAGVGVRSQDQYVSFKADGKSYWAITHEVEEIPAPEGMPDVPKPRTQARTLEAGKHRFLMLRSEMPSLPSAGSQPATGPAATIRPELRCGLVRYAFDGEQLVTYALEERVLVEAIRTGQVDGLVPKERDFSPSSIRKLDRKTLDALTKWADDPKLWRQVARYDRVADLDKALAESRTYPATSQTAVDTTVDLEIPDLQFFAEDESRMLLRHLAAVWKVVDEGDDLVCEVQPGWRFRFGEKPGGLAHWGLAFKAASPRAGMTRLNLRQTEQAIESFLAVGQKGLWFEVHERTNVEARSETRDAIKWLKPFLGDLRRSEADIRKLGYASSLVPSGTVRKGEPSIEVLAKSDGFYEVRAWINPGAYGRVSVRLFDRKSGEPLRTQSASDPAAPLFAGSKRRVGWSPDPRTQFPYGEYIFATSESDQSFDARVELWFRPEASGSASKLCEAEQVLKTSKPRRR